MSKGQGPVLFTDYYFGYTDEINFNLALHTDSTFCMRIWNQGDESFLGSCWGDYSVKVDILNLFLEKDEEGLSSAQYRYSDKDSSYIFKDTANTDFCPYPFLYIPDEFRMQFLSRKKLTFIEPQFSPSDQRIILKRNGKREDFCVMFNNCSVNLANHNRSR